MSDVRYLFDKFLEKYPTLSQFMSQNAQIAPSPKFELSLLKIQEESYGSLDVQKPASVKHLLKRITETESETAGESFAHEIIKKRKVEKASKNRDGPYMKTRFLVPTSDTVERFLSFRVYIQRLSSETASVKFGNAAVLEAK